MAIGFRNFTSLDVHNPGTTQAVTLPAGNTSTDVVCAIFGAGSGSFSGGTTWSAPSGWTAISTAFHVTDGSGNDVFLGGWWALGSVANLTFTRGGSASGDLGVVVLGFTGVDNTTPIDAVGTTNSNTGAGSITTNAITIVTNQAWHVVGLASWIGGTWSATGFTLKQNAAANEDASCGYNTTPKGTGSTGTVVFSTTGGSAGQILLAMPFALRPAAGAASPILQDLEHSPGFQPILAM